MSHDERLHEIVVAHQQSVTHQHAMRDAAADRDRLVREAIQAGVPVIPIAKALGVDRQRIYQMARPR
ncbi:MAG: hypothetical protein ACTIKT_06985 [Microbacterium sp.]